MHSLHGHISYSQDFIFDLNSSNGVSCTYLVGSFAQIAGALYVNVSVPKLTVFLFSAENSRRFLRLYWLMRNWNSDFNIGGTIFNIL